MNWDSYKYFSEKEFRCKCGCGRADMDHDFMKKLSDLRLLMGFPFIISSGFRCPEYNNKVSHTGLTGPHTTGKACDIKTAGERAWDILSFAGNMGFKGIGVSQSEKDWSKRFIHLDTLDDGRPALWSY